MFCVSIFFYFDSLRHFMKQNLYILKWKHQFYTNSELKARGGYFIPGWNILRLASFGGKLILEQFISEWQCPISFYIVRSLLDPPLTTLDPLLYAKTPLRISTPKLTRGGEKCIIDWKVLGVLILNNGSEFQYLLLQKVNDYTENSQKWKLVQQKHVWVWQLNIIVPRG